MDTEQEREKLVEQETTIKIHDGRRDVRMNRPMDCKKRTDMAHIRHWVRVSSTERGVALEPLPALPSQLPASKHCKKRMLENERET